MNRSSKKWIAALFLIFAVVACGGQSGSTTSPLNVETVVAQTMQALTPGSPSTDLTPAPQPETSDLLPHSLYFLDSDSAGFLQVHRLERDGTTVRQITFEPSDVQTYDVSPADGSVAYISNNQLLLVNTDGSGRRILVDGGPVDEDNPFMSRVNAPAWSPNGQTIAYHHGGLNFYAVQTGLHNKVLDDIIDQSAGFAVPRELYFPESYSPDGSKLLVNMGHHEGGLYAIYYTNANALVRLSPGLASCCSASWTPDSNAVYVASHIMGMISPGLWRINADGNVDILLSGDAPNAPINFALAPILGPDGQLYFFHNAISGSDDFVDRVPLYMVRSAPDGVTGRTNLVAAPFENVNEILWAPDAGFAVIAFAPVENVYRGGQAEIAYTDGRPNVPLVPFASDMRWGP